MNKIKELRFKAGLTLRDLAEKSGISLYSVMAFEAGQHMPYKNTVKALAKALGVSEKELRSQWADVMWCKPEAGGAENERG